MDHSDHNQSAGNFEHGLFISVRSIMRESVLSTVPCVLYEIPCSITYDDRNTGDEMVENEAIAHFGLILVMIILSCYHCSSVPPTDRCINYSLASSEESSLSSSVLIASRILIHPNYISSQIL